MDYNTTANKLILPEYGRNIQKMAEHLLLIEDREKRNKAANELLGIMGNMFPHLRDIKDFKHKLWDHLAAMTRYNLDVDYPYKVTRVDELPKPDKLPYNTNHIKFKHYGKTLQRLINKAKDIEDEEEKQQLIILIANHMKKLYVIWNLKSVTDEIVFSDLAILSDGKLVPTGDLKLMHVQTQQPKPVQNTSNNNNNYKGKRQGSFQQNKNSNFKKRR